MVRQVVRMIQGQVRAVSAEEVSQVLLATSFGSYAAADASHSLAPEDSCYRN
jgi:putative copper export protein